MASQIFEFSSASGVEYKLSVNEMGFALVDAKTDELLVDASVLVHQTGELYRWPIEIMASSTNREYYFRVLPHESDKIEFGISRRDI